MVYSRWKSLTRHYDSQFVIVGWSLTSRLVFRTVGCGSLGCAATNLFKSVIADTVSRVPLWQCWISLTFHRVFRSVSSVRVRLVPLDRGTVKSCTLRKVVVERLQIRYACEPIDVNLRTVNGASVPFSASISKLYTSVRLVENTGTRSVKLATKGYFSRNRSRKNSRKSYKF